MKIVLGPENFNTIMKSCKPFIKKGAILPMYAMIELACDGDVVTATALDGHKLISVTVLAAPDSDKGKIIVPLMKTAGKKARKVIISEDKNELRVETAEGAQIYPKTEGEYFNHSAIFPLKEDPESVCYFDPKLLADAFSAFPDKYVKVSYYGDKKGITIQGTDQQAFVLPVSVNK